MGTFYDRLQNRYDNYTLQPKTNGTYGEEYSTQVPFIPSVKIRLSANLNRGYSHAADRLPT